MLCGHANNQQNIIILQVHSAHFGTYVKLPMSIFVTGFMKTLYVKRCAGGRMHFVVAQVENCRNPVFITFMSKNLSTKGHLIEFQYIRSIQNDIRVHSNTFRL